MAGSQSPSNVPLALWAVTQTTAQYQRRGRYVPTSVSHPAKMVPELARRIVADFSAPGALVVDPLAGIGTTLVEAAALGRPAVGVELEQRWATLARANAGCLPEDQSALVEVCTGDARRLLDVLADLVGAVDLIATSPPYACEVGTIDKSAWLSGRSLCDAASRNYSAEPTNLGHARGENYLAAMAEIYAGCFSLLHRGGFLVTVTKNLRRRGRTFDLAAATVALARQAGFRYLQHIVALGCAIRDGDLVARPSFWQLTHTRRARARGEPAHLVTHEDALVFERPSHQ